MIKGRTVAQIIGTDYSADFVSRYQTLDDRTVMVINFHTFLGILRTKLIRMITK